MTSKEKNIPFDEFARVDEKKASQWLYPVDYELQMNPEYHFVPMNDVLYDLQKKSILEAADKENCVIVGRCGNYILKDYKDKHISLFIYAPFEERVKTVMARTGREEKSVRKMVKRTDKVLIMNISQTPTGWICCSMICASTAALFPKNRLSRW